jgi:hypothetical protein
MPSAKRFLFPPHCKTTASSLAGVQFTKSRSTNGIFGTAHQSTMPLSIIASIVLGLVCCLLFSGCTFKPQDWFQQKQVTLPKHVPTKHYITPEADESALIRIRLALLMQQIQGLHYDQIHLEDPAARNVKPVLPLKPKTKTGPPEIPQNKETFLRLMYCADRFLGPLKSADHQAALILQRVGTADFVVAIRTLREHDADVQEQVHFQRRGLDYVVTGYYIKAVKSSFYDCVNRIQFPKTKPLSS